MNVASLEQSQNLYELSGWQDRKALYQYWDMSRAAINNGIDPQPWRDDNRGTELHNPDFIPADSQKRFVCPAYDLGYLLRKILHEYGKITLTHDYGHKQWWATDAIGHAVVNADTPENALSKLAIGLFNQGILSKESKS